MTRLRSEQTQRYQHCGYLFPLPALDAAEAAEMRSRFISIDPPREGRDDPAAQQRVIERMMNNLMPPKAG